MNIFSSEILVFTPKGKIINLPKDSTVLDFAFEIHSDIAYQCIGAKIGRSVVPLNHKLGSGDIIEVLNSTGQKPAKEWYHFVSTPKAKKGLNKVIFLNIINYQEKRNYTFKLETAKLIKKT